MKRSSVTAPAEATQVQHEPDSQPSTQVAVHGKVVVLGGYGHVGRALVRRLAPEFPGRVVVAGRNAQKARSLAEQIGFGATAREADALGSHDALLAGASAVVVCMDVPDTALARRCLQAGIGYVDVTASERLISEIEALNELAIAAGAAAIVSVGLVPGLSNVLATAAVRALGSPERIDIIVMLGLGDRHGKAATTWTLQQLDRPFTVSCDGTPELVRAFRGSHRFRLPGERLARRAHRFPFPDQTVIARTLGVPTAATWLCFDSRLATQALAALVAIGGSRLIQQPQVLELISHACELGGLGSDAWVVGVRAALGPRTRSWLARGRAEAAATGLFTAEAVRRLLQGTVAPGSHHFAQLAELGSLLPILESTGITLDVECEL